MLFVLEIDCEDDASAAFGPYPAPDDFITRGEVARLLQTVAVRVGRDAQQTGRIHDLNGVDVGEFRFTRRKAH